MSEIYHTTNKNFFIKASFDLSWTVLQRNSHISKIRTIPFRSLSQTLDLGKLYNRTSTASHVLSTYWTKTDVQCDKLVTVNWQHSWIYVIATADSQLMTLSVHVYTTARMHDASDRSGCDSWHLFHTNWPNTHKQLSQANRMPHAVAKTARNDFKLI